MCKHGNGGVHVFCCRIHLHCFIKVRYLSVRTLHGQTRCHCFIKECAEASILTAKLIELQTRCLVTGAVECNAPVSEKGNVSRPEVTGEIAHECKYCGQYFFDASACKQHEQTHVALKPYSCKYCKKCFGYSSQCKRHEQTHTGEKPHSCKHCNKCFSTSSSCKLHERTHTGSKPYTCMH
ncbi:hypothetical protein ACROYT_G018527 [Oculina patagonica]